MFVEPMPRARCWLDPGVTEFNNLSLVPPTPTPGLLGNSSGMSEEC